MFSFRLYNQILPAFFSNQLVKLASVFSILSKWPLYMHHKEDSFDLI